MGMLRRVFNREAHAHGSFVSRCRSIAAKRRRNRCVWFVDVSIAIRDVVIVDSRQRRGSGTVTFRTFTNIDPGIPNPTIGSIFVFGDESTAPRVAEFRITVTR